jgi:membrane protease YdiL (CAAX protease family)
MPIQLGQDPWIIICLMLLEILLILIPAFFSSRIEKRSFKEVVKDMGFRKSKSDRLIYFMKIISGIALGFLFYLIAQPMLNFFKNFIIKNVFGSSYIKEGVEGAIQTNPINPTFVQFILITIMQLAIVGPCEESFFRGFLLKRIKDKFKTIYAIIFSSTCFTLYHVPPFLVPISTIVTFFFYYFTFGILLALICVSFDYSLIPCSIAHSFLNILIMFL